ncbi:hypothetical protein [Deefgea piscis]|uniref:hypothetical protein n=1 Tax=Deefgea piscis TaxID=2739061 RepID=UPI001C81AEED|nr:hypothetical protein [Deefgea piscis]QZA80039.1 hypothetical protein K4H25_10845 [Deefgea piscis]
MFKHLNSKVNTYLDLKFVYFIKQNVHALADCSESDDKPVTDRIFALETDTSMEFGVAGSPCALNKKNLRGQARSYAARLN